MSAGVAGEAIRPARITDGAALNTLSREVHAAPDSHRRSLGVPAPQASQPRIELSSLIPSWLPMRAPSLHLVADDDGQLVGSCRAIEEPRRADWVVIELDAVPTPAAQEVRWALLNGLIEEAGRRNVPRLFAACADVPENNELFGQAGFVAYAQEDILYRPPESGRGGAGWIRGWLSRDGRAATPTDLPSGPRPTLQPATAGDAWHLFDLWTHATPPSVARMEDYTAGDWQEVGHEAVVPRTSLNPLLHFTEVSGWLNPGPERVGGFAQHGACREGPHYLRFLVRDGTDGAAFLATVLTAMGEGPRAAGVLSPVRTYEGSGLQAAADVGFEPVGRVTMMVREVRARVRQPALVPAV